MYSFRENSNFPFSNQKIITLVEVFLGISWCRDLLGEVVLRYVLESKLTGGACLEVYHDVTVY